jgi:hypothetical protein
MTTLEEYMQAPVQEKAIYRGWPLQWTVEKSTGKDERGQASQAVAIAIRFAIHQRWHPQEEQWSNEWPPCFFTDARVWVVKKDGSENEGAVANLGRCGLWDGDWDKLALPPPPVYVHLDVDSEVFEGKTRWRANWVNPDADVPATRGGFAPVDTSLLASLKQRFQSKTRAIAGGAPKGAPPPPPPVPQMPGLPTQPQHAPVVGAPPLVMPSTPPPAVQPMPPRMPPQAAPAAPAGPRSVGPPPRAAAPAAPAAPRAPQPPRSFADTPEVLPPQAAGDADDPLAPDETPF